MTQKLITHTPLIAGCMKWGAWGAKLDTYGYLERIEACQSVGINTFDLADIYGGSVSTEEEFGMTLKAMPNLREQLYLITKCGIRLPNPGLGNTLVKHYDTSARHIIASVERSLKLLHTDRIDLLLLHRPDALMQHTEIAEVFNGLKKTGKVLRFGVSNFTSSQLRLLQTYWPIEAAQLQLSISSPAAIFDGTIDTCVELGIRVQAWSPLGAGTLLLETTDERIRKIRGVAEILAKKHGCREEHIFLAWLLRHPAGIWPVIGTTQPDRIRVAAAAGQITLDREEWYRLLMASMGRDVD